MQQHEHDRIDMIYQTLMEIREDQGEMKSELRAVLEQTTKTNGRVTSLEHWRAAVVAGAIVFAAIVSWLWQLLTNK